MILTGSKIIESVNNGSIYIDNFEIESVTTNSYDLRLGNTLIKYKDEVLDPMKENKFESIDIPEAGYLLHSGCFILGESKEIINSNEFVPIIHAKSGIARKGLFVHVTADLIDIGYKGNITFQFYATFPLKIYKNMKIAQVSFWKPYGDIVLYTGKYQNNKGPQPSKSYLDRIEEV